MGIFDLISNWMIKYNPTHRNYAGDIKMIPATQHNQAAIDRSKESSRVKIIRPYAE